MRITVRFFAVVRDRAGVSQTELLVDPGASVQTAIEVIDERFPTLSALLPRIGCALNQSYVDRTAALSDGDELALIPPVSGGTS